MRPSKYATPGLHIIFQPPKETTSGFVIIQKCCFKSNKFKVHILHSAHNLASFNWLARFQADLTAKSKITPSKLESSKKNCLETLHFLDIIFMITHLFSPKRISHTLYI